ncbi:hypothetical protein Bcell_2298 [Evansella cellulosilytica DSM 2522]|uniref:Uncharacterized protein n=2 Tax=Evansella TaxID=2837485 RepID=E6TQP7_EVAC2|nr:hypothetical protein Bcell_2298 [Evansella cellulosilytica DSM 2522]
MEQKNADMESKIVSLTQNTFQISAKTNDLYELLQNLKYLQKEEVEALKNQLHKMEKQQQEKIGKQISDIQKTIHTLKTDQETTKLNEINEHEILNLLLEGLYERIDTLKAEHESELNKLSHEITGVKESFEEANSIQLQNDKTNADLLYKLREHHFEFEAHQLKEQQKLVQLMSELQEDVTKLNKMLEVKEVLVKS